MKALYVPTWESGMLTSGLSTPRWLVLLSGFHKDLVSPTGSTCCLTLQDLGVACLPMIIFSWRVQITMWTLTDPPREWTECPLLSVGVWGSHTFCVTLMCTGWLSQTGMVVVEMIDSYRGQLWDSSFLWIPRGCRYHPNLFVRRSLWFLAVREAIYLIPIEWITEAVRSSPSQDAQISPLSVMVPSLLSRSPLTLWVVPMVHHSHWSKGGHRHI
jgi:hypothetical protein